MDAISVRADGLRKSFGSRLIFFDVQFVLHAGEGLGIVGRNGSGKSTLAKIISGILSSSGGSVKIVDGEKEVDEVRRNEHIGFVSPYLHLYEEFSALENLDIVRKVRGIAVSLREMNELLDLMQLGNRKSSYVRMFSDGMKQRLKYACALLHKPAVLILDEPTTNLDGPGTDLVHRIMREHVQKGILVVATNDSRDLLCCNRSVDLNAFAGEGGS